MSETVIRADNIGKMYRIGARRRRAAGVRDIARQLGNSLFGYLASTFRAPSAEETLWALRGVNFEIKQGEVIGVIGANGAGKSTLLKILSRITEPTEGRAEIRGRVGSLLEVGTGFHPELTGRENIYLNGAILGMRKRETDAKFDEIVAFAEVDKFIDTPVKRYSSGMYVRLAFAVAAHLEPEILLVDEVLAVGDAAFQKKCLGKMNSVTREGRTVMFVSHNMVAVEGLCTRTMLIDKGGLKFFGSTNEALAMYLGNAASRAADGFNIEGRSGAGEVRVTHAEIHGSGPSRDITMGEEAELVLDLNAEHKCTSVNISFVVLNQVGVKVFNASTMDVGMNVVLPAGTSRWRCKIGPLMLRAGTYHIAIGIGSGSEVLDLLPSALSFRVAPADVYGSAKMLQQSDGIVYFPYTWHGADSVEQK